MLKMITVGLVLFPFLTFGAKGTMVLQTPEELTWTSRDEKSPSVSTLWGNPEKGASAGFIKFPKGISIPLHSHAVNHIGTVVKGQFILIDEKGTEKTLPTGSAVRVDAGVKHAVRCGADEDCVLFAWITGKDVTKMVAAPGNQPN